MLDKIIAFSIKNKLIVTLMMVVLIIWGLWSATQLSIDAVPDITNNQVQIITNSATLAAEEVEQLVTYPIEQSLTNLPSIIEMRSISRFGLSVVTVVFDEKVNIYFARQLISEKLKDVSDVIPQGTNTPMLAPVSTGLGEIFQYIIHPTKEAENKYSAMELRTMQDWIVARQLYGTPGVAEVNSFGGFQKQYEVAINPQRLLAMGVTVSDIFSALESNNENTGGSYIDKKPNAYFIRAIGLIHSFEDIKNIVVKNNKNGIPILIKDVAEVQFGGAVRYGAVTYNGEKDVVGGIIMMLKGANSGEVIKQVKEKLPIIQKSLPADVTIEPYLDRTDLVNRAITTVETNLIEGALIVIFVLVLFLGNFRAGLIVASAIPLSMLFALGLMNVFGVSANLMSLGAIDFGLIVDGAVIIVESVFHRITSITSKAELTRGELNETVYQSSKQMMNVAAFGQVIILIVYLPIFSLSDIEGKMFIPMAQTVSFAILGAFILSLTYIPMVSSLVLSRKTSHKQNMSDRLMSLLVRLYEPLLDKAIRFRKSVIITTILLFLTSLLIFSRMGGEFIPTLQEGDFAFHCILPQGTSLNQSIETASLAMRTIKQFDEVKVVVGKTGTAEVPTDVMPPEATDIMIILKPKSEWKRDISYDELANEILTKLENIPGVFFEKNQPIQMRFNELMTGIRQDVAVKIFGENMDTLLTYANHVFSVIQPIEGVTEPMVERVDGVPQIVIKYNRAQIANYGLTIKDANHVVSTAFAGGKAGVVFENERRFDLVVRLEEQFRKNITDFNLLFIPTPNGVQIPLSQIAEIKYEMGPSQISRESGKRRIVIGFNIQGRDVAGVVREIEEQLDHKVNLPEGYFLTYGGQFENLQAATQRLLVAVPVALMLIFILLYFTFRSTKQALLIYTAIPMSAIGGIFALLVRGMPFSISAGIGFIALFGVSVLNGIVLIGTFNQLEKEGMSNLFERIKKGTQIRLRPVLMTATVASLGFMPMALSQGAGAEVQKPLATVVIGGLTTATLLTLFVLPLLYGVFSNFSWSKIRTYSNLTSLSFVLLSLSGLSMSLTAQTQLTEEQAIDSALKNNLKIQSVKLSTLSNELLKYSVFELPKTDVSLQYGQYSSIHRDLGITITQNIPFPTFFWAKSKLADAQIAESNLQQQIVERDIRSQIKSLYNLFYYQTEVKNTLLGLDSAYVQWVESASLRFASGESNWVEKTTAETKHGQLVQQLRKNQVEINNTLLQLKVMLNTQENIQPIYLKEYSVIPITIDFNSSLTSESLSTKLLNQTIEVSKRKKDLEDSSLLPDFSIGYFNQSLIGYQNVNGQEIYFDKNKRFDGINIGISIPINVISQYEKSRGLDLQNESFKQETENDKLLAEMQISNAIQNYHQLQNEYQFYLTTALTNADELIRTASLSLQKGEIGYMEYLQAIQTATDIQLSYLTCVYQLNQSVIMLNGLFNQL